MLAFINSTHTKAEAVALAEWHKQQDSYIQRTYGKDTPEGWKGCSVGCMAKGKHEDYPKLFGIDAKVAHLSDGLFEELPAPDYKHFTVKLFNSIQEGTDTRLVWFRFMYWMLADAEHGVVKTNNDAAVTSVIELFKRAAEGETVSRDQWEAAHASTAAADRIAYVAYTARAAAHVSTAAYTSTAPAYFFTAAYAAINAARTADAKHVVGYVLYAASSKAVFANANGNDNAARDAGYAAAARTKHYQIMADKLCYFLGGGV